MIQGFYRLLQPPEIEKQQKRKQNINRYRIDQHIANSMFQHHIRPKKIECHTGHAQYQETNGCPSFSETDKDPENGIQQK